MPLGHDRAESEDAAKEAALRLLSRGPRTEREVTDRLLARGFVVGAVERAIERLRRVSLLDDRAFARNFLRVELPRKPQGRRLLAARLRGRGVPAPLLEELDRLLEDDPDLAERSLDTEEGRARAALAQLDGRYARREPRERARRLAGSLLRRGFDWDTVRGLVTGGNEETQEPR